MQTVSIETNQKNYFRMLSDDFFFFDCATGICN